MNGSLITIGNISASGITAGTLSADIEISTGSIKSNNYVAGSAGWKIDATGAEFSNALFRGTVEASNLKIGTGGISLKCEGYDIPATAFGQVLQVSSVNANLSSTPLTGTSVTFGGPQSGVPMERRLRTGTVSFLLAGNGVVDHHMTLVYRVGAGAWTFLHHTVEPQNGYGSAAIQYKVDMWVGSTTTLQFALSTCDESLNDYGEPGLSEAALTVTAFNL